MHIFDAIPVRRLLPAIAAEPGGGDARTIPTSRSSSRQATREGRSAARTSRTDSRREPREAAAIIPFSGPEATGFNVSVAITDSAGVASGEPFPSPSRAGPTAKRTPGRQDAIATSRQPGRAGDVSSSTRSTANDAQPKTIAATNPTDDNPTALRHHRLLQQVKYILEDGAGHYAFDGTSSARTSRRKVHAMAQRYDRAIYRRAEAGSQGQAPQGPRDHRPGQRCRSPGHRTVRPPSSPSRQGYQHAGAALRPAPTSPRSRAPSRSSTRTSTFRASSSRPSARTQDAIAKYGIRNSHLTSIAPTGTVSLGRQRQLRDRSDSPTASTAPQSSSAARGAGEGGLRTASGPRQGAPASPSRNTSPPDRRRPAGRFRGERAALRHQREDFETAAPGRRGEGLHDLPLAGSGGHPRVKDDGGEPKRTPGGGAGKPTASTGHRTEVQRQAKGGDHPDHHRVLQPGRPQRAIPVPERTSNRTSPREMCPKERTSPDRPAPGPNADPDRPLAPLRGPPREGVGRAGRPIAQGLPQDLRPHHLLHTFPGRWKRDDSGPPGTRGPQPRGKPLLGGRHVILVGRNVAEAFGYPAQHLDFHQCNPTSLGLRGRWVPAHLGAQPLVQENRARDAARAFWEEAPTVRPPPSNGHLAFGRETEKV